MVEYIVTFHISTAFLSLEELTEMLGKPGPDSHTHGEGYVDAKWQIESQAEKTATLEEHLESLAKQLPSLEKINLISSYENDLVIAAFFDDAMCSVYISPHWVNLFNEYDIQIEVSCYPSNFGE